MSVVSTLDNRQVSEHGDIVTLVLPAKYLTIITQISDNGEVHLLSDVMFSQECPQPTSKNPGFFTERMRKYWRQNWNPTQYYHDSSVGFNGSPVDRD